MIPKGNCLHSSGNTIFVHGVSKPETTRGNGVMFLARHTDIQPSVNVHVYEGWTHDATYSEELVIYTQDGVCLATPVRLFGTCEAIPEEAPKTPEQLREARFKKMQETYGKVPPPEQEIH
mgnify:CR=1 FL=1